MKCQKCNAENIIEAVRCGICGTRLKHVKVLDDFTGSKQVQSSLRRGQSLPVNHQNPSTSPFSKPMQVVNREIVRPSQRISNVSIADIVLNPDTKVEEKAKILLDSWQEKAKDRLTGARKPQKKGKWFGAFLVLIFIGIPVIDKIGTAIFKEISYQIRERNRIAEEQEAQEMILSDQAVVVAEDGIAIDAVAPQAFDETDSIEMQLFSRFSGMKEFEKNVEQYYAEKGRLPSALKQIESYTQTEFSDYTYESFAIGEDGKIVGLFKSDPEKKIYLVPELSKRKIIGWQCYSIGISDEIVKDCHYSETDPFQ